jgi:hypothetical protein
MMTFTPLNVIVIVLLGGFFAIAANMLSFVMIGKINERVPEAERISYFWWSTGVKKRYKELFPSSKIPLLVNVCVVTLLVLFALTVRLWVFGSGLTGK